VINHLATLNSPWSRGETGVGGEDFTLIGGSKTRRTSRRNTIDCDLDISIPKGLEFLPLRNPSLETGVGL